MRLAVLGAQSAVQLLAARVRGATVTPYLAAEVANARALLEAEPGDRALAAEWLGAGRHVLLTAHSWMAGEALDALQAAARGGAQLCILNPERFLPSRQLIRQQLDSGKLGEPGLIRIHRWESGAGDELSTPLTRELDVTLWLMGSAPNLVYGVSAGGSQQVHLGFPGGGMALVDYVDSLPAGDGYQSLSVIASTGAAYADDHQNVQLHYAGGHPRAVLASEGQRALIALVQHFVSALGSGEALAGSVDEWRTTMSVASEAQRSAAKREPIPYGVVAA